MPLAAISPDNSALEVVLLVPTRAAGFLKKGQEVRIRIDAFPFERYGMVLGRIGSISTSVVPIQAAAPTGPAGGAAYRVRVLLPRPWIVMASGRRRLVPGMTVTADIVIEKSHLWRAIVDPLSGAVSSSA